MSAERPSRLAGARPVFFGAVLCCLLWGSAFPCIKIGYRLFAVPSGDAASQILFAGCRFTLAGLMVLAAHRLLSRRPVWPRRTAWRPIAVLGLTQTAVQYLLFYIGLAHASGVSSSIISGANAAVTILMTCFLFRTEAITPAKLAGCALGFGGVVVLNLSGGNGFAFAWNGEGFVLLSTIASALSTIAIKRFSEREDPVLLSGWQFTCGGLLLTLCGFVCGGRLHPQSPAALALLLYLAFLSAAAYTLWGLLLQHNPVSGVSAYKCLIPLFGSLLSALLLQESGTLLRWQTLAALALVIGGIACLTPRKKKA